MPISNQNNIKYDGVYNRVQDKELLEMSDLKKCMSMHQPWASLLIAGVKKHEGRSWYTSHRGRLWIASTAKPVDAESIKEMENFYRAHYNGNLGFFFQFTSELYSSFVFMFYYFADGSIEFPGQYPSGCLLGCISIQVNT